MWQYSYTLSCLHAHNVCVPYENNILWIGPFLWKQIFCEDEIFMKYCKLKKVNCAKTFPQVVKRILNRSVNCNAKVGSHWGVDCSQKPSWKTGKSQLMSTNEQQHENPKTRKLNFLSKKKEFSQSKRHLSYFRYYRKVETCSKRTAIKKIKHMKQKCCGIRHTTQSSTCCLHGPVDMSHRESHF